MKRIAAILFVLTVSLFGQFVPNISVGISDDAASVILNPAGLGIARGFNMLFLAPVNSTGFQSDQEDFSLFLQLKGTGLGYTHLGEGRDLFHWVYVVRAM